MYRVVGLKEEDEDEDEEVTLTESFTEALEIFHEHCTKPINKGKRTLNMEKSCYIEAVGETATARMQHPYVFEFAVKAGLIKDAELAAPVIEPKTTELIAAFSRAAVLQMLGSIGCH